VFVFFSGDEAKRIEEFGGPFATDWVQQVAVYSILILKCARVCSVKLGHGAGTC
jgi:hypothetical protein